MSNNMQKGRMEKKRKKKSSQRQTQKKIRHDEDKYLNWYGTKILVFSLVLVSFFSF